jgi:hypothetical protein
MSLGGQNERREWETCLVHSLSRTLFSSRYTIDSVYVLFFFLFLGSGEPVNTSGTIELGCVQDRRLRWLRTSDSVRDLYSKLGPVHHEARVHLTPVMLTHPKWG